MKLTSGLKGSATMDSTSEPATRRGEDNDQFEYSQAEVTFELEMEGREARVGCVVDHKALRLKEAANCAAVATRCRSRLVVLATASIRKSTGSRIAGEARRRARLRKASSERTVHGCGLGLAEIGH